MQQAQKFYIIAGEASGDLHASNMMREMLKKQPKCIFRFWGGDEMIKVSKNNNGVCVKHIRNLAFMGFAEVLRNIKTIFSNISFCKKDIREYSPDKLILVDYPGFNLRIAKWAKKQGIHVIYYISPQVWAWKKQRVKIIKKVVDEMYVILPFEKDFYKQMGMEVCYVGHPLLDAIEEYKLTQQKLPPINKEPEQLLIAILPGSRKQEIKKILPIMLESVQSFSKHKIILAAAPNIEPIFYTALLKKYPKVSILYSKTYDILSHADLALVTSGTATLETALFGVPQVVCYIGSPISYLIAKRLITIKYISLVNLIMDRAVVKELIQHECNPQTIAIELEKLLPRQPVRLQMLNDYIELKERLGNGGASAKLAKYIINKP